MAHEFLNGWFMFFLSPSCASGEASSGGDYERSPAGSPRILTSQSVSSTDWGMVGEIPIFYHFIYFFVVGLLNFDRNNGWFAQF